MSYRDLFEALNSAEIRYVVLRRYDALPERRMEDSRDIDVLIDSSQFDIAVDHCNRVGFDPDETSGPSRIRLYRRALAKPGKATRQLVRAPVESVKKILQGSEVNLENPRHRSTQLYRDSQVVDLMNNLAYQSPMDGAMIPVDPEVTEGMLDRREAEGCFYVPSAPDELAHLIPHCVFDKGGRFPPYYRDRCDELFQSIQTEGEQFRLLEDLLGIVFYEADQLVLELLKEGRYDSIRKELRQFSDY